MNSFVIMGVEKVYRKQNHFNIYERSIKIGLCKKILYFYLNDFMVLRKFEAVMLDEGREKAYIAVFLRSNG